MYGALLAKIHFSYIYFHLNILQLNNHSEAEMLHLYLLQTCKTFHMVSFCRQSIEDVFRVDGPVALGLHEQHLRQK